MAFELPPLPNFNVQVPDFTQKALEGAQLRNMLSEMALRKALAPGQVQAQQQQLQQQQIATQLQTMQLQGQQALTDWLKNGDASEDIPASNFSSNDKIATFIGVRPDDPILNVIRSMAKHNVPAPMLLTEAQGMLQRRNEYFKGTKEEQDAQKAERMIWENTLIPLHELPEDQRSAQLAAKLPLLQENSKTDPLLRAYAAGLQGHPENTDQAYNAIVGENTVLGFHKQAAEASEAAAKAAKETAAAAAPTANQLTTALSGVNSYSQIPENMRASLQNEIRNAPNKEALDKVQERADKINESFQRSADARAQANAMRDVGTRNLVAGRLLQMDAELDKNLDQTTGIRGLLDLSKGGNETATAAALTRFAEHEIVEGGVKRMNQLEYKNLASGLGSYGRQFSAWVDKGFQGQMPAATNKEIQTILDAEDAAAHTAHDRSVGHVVERFGAGEVRGNQPAPQTTGQKPKSLTAAQISAYAQAHGVSEVEVRRQAKAQGISVP